MNGWSVGLDTSGPMAVVSAARAVRQEVRRADVEVVTRAEVAALFDSIGTVDPVGWAADLVTTALLLGTSRVETWEAERWPWADSGDVPTPTADDPRAEYAWLRAIGPGGATTIGTYQDGLLFGLQPQWTPETADRRPPPRVGHANDVIVLDGLVSGEIDRVDVVWDTTVDDGLTGDPTIRMVTGGGLLTEILLHSGGLTTLLVAAEHNDRWCVYDESVVPLPDLATADRLPWSPPRPVWRAPAPPV